MEDLISLSGNVVQKQQLFHLNIKIKLLQSQASGDSVKLRDALQAAKSVLVESRTLKSLLEGSDYVPKAQKVDNCKIAELKKLVWTSDVQSMSQERLQQITRSLLQILEGVEVEFVVISTNSIYASLYEDPGQKAKHNSLFCVYKLPNSDIYGPYPAPVIEQCSVIDEDWFYACELSHFTSALLKGKVRAVLASSMIDCVNLYTSESFDSLLKQPLIGTMEFLTQCTGRSVGMLTRKHTSGMSVREGSTLYDFCESSQMLSVASEALRLLGIDLSQTPSVAEVDRAKRFIEQLKGVNEHTDTIKKVKLWEEIVSWANDIQLLVKANKSMIAKKSSNVVRDIGLWHCSKRYKPTNNNAVQYTDESLDVVKKLQSDVAGFVSTLQPQQILLIVRAGSYLYNLHTATSDTDYLVIYVSDTQELLRRVTRPRECHLKRATEMDVGAYEIRNAVELLIKGSIIMLEVLFSDNFEFVTPAFKELQGMRQHFVTEKAIQQYWGLIGHNIKLIKSEEHKGTPKQRKLLYQTFHKLGCVEQMVSGEVPTIRLSGEQRDFIMNIRTKPPEGEYSSENLVKLVEKRFQEIQMKAATRSTRLREATDPQPLANWLMKLRGLV